MDTLMTFLRRYGKGFVDTFGERLAMNDAKGSDIAAALTLLGRVEHPKTKDCRLNVLMANLSSSQVRLRDGAVAGLGYMMSSEAIPALEMAVQAETNRHLRRDMARLLFCPNTM